MNIKHWGRYLLGGVVFFSFIAGPATDLMFTNPVLKLLAMLAFSVVYLVLFKLHFDE